MDEWIELGYLNNMNQLMEEQSSINIWKQKQTITNQHELNSIKIEITQDEWMIQVVPSKSSNTNTPMVEWNPNCKVFTIEIETKIEIKLQVFELKVELH